MYKIQLFEEKSTRQLQEVINAWLSAHKDIAVIHSNLAPVLAEDATARSYNFYFVYTTAESQHAELIEMAAEVQPENSIEVTDINPEILKATS